MDTLFQSRILEAVKKAIEQHGVVEECPYLVSEQIPKEINEELTQKLGKSFEQEIKNNVMMNNIPYKDKHVPWYILNKTYSQVLELFKQGRLREIFSS
ncbi:MAG: hypothetical protein QXP53_00770 [Candidatus Pacearchaeota archaeon]